MVRAIRPIKTGDEVLVNYIDSYLRREERQEKRWDGFRFKCTCAECTNKWSEGRDKNLEGIRRLVDEEYISMAELEPRRALGLVEGLLETLKSEDLNTPLDRGTIHYDACQIADRAPNLDKMRFHLKKAHECWVHTDGEGSYNDLMGKNMMASRIGPAR